VCVCVCVCWRLGLAWRGRRTLTVDRDQQTRNRCLPRMLRRHCARGAMPHRLVGAKGGEQQPRAAQPHVDPCVPRLLLQRRDLLVLDEGEHDVIEPTRQTAYEEDDQVDQWTTIEVVVDRQSTERPYKDNVVPDIIASAVEKGGVVYVQRERLVNG
jgi:hypothetical protein